VKLALSPACFASPAQYARWLATAKQTGLPRSGYCTDCTPDYQRVMRSARRCAHPGTTFGRDGDGMVVGRHKANGMSRAGAARR
jgi:hypothetical protein